MSKPAKKESLFLKSLKSNPHSIVNSKGFPTLIPIDDSIKEEVPLESKTLPNLLNFPSKPDFFGVSDNEYSKISQESNDMIKKMTEDEIKENQKELLGTLDPKLLAFFKGMPSMKKEELKKEPKQEKEENKNQEINKKQEMKMKEEENKNEEMKESEITKQFKTEEKLQKIDKSDGKNLQKEEKQTIPELKQWNAQNMSDKTQDLNLENEEKNDYFLKVFFDAEGKEVENKSELQNDEEKIEVFCEKQEHSFDNLFNILERFPNNAAIVMFSLFKLEKILRNFWIIFKKTKEVIEFKYSGKKVYRVDLIRDFLKNCAILEVLTRFLGQKNMTIQINALKLLRTFLKLIVVDNLTAYLKGKIEIKGDRGIQIKNNYFCNLMKK